MKRILSVTVINLLLITGLSIMIMPVYSNVTAESWCIKTVDKGGDRGKGGTAIALDSNDYPHIFYCNVDVFKFMYARWTGSEWSIEPIDGTNEWGGSVSIALDSNDRPHLSYFNDSEYELRYAHWNGNKWSIEKIDRSGSGEFHSIAVDSNDYPHIAYSNDTGDNLRYAKWTGTQWVYETVDDYRTGFYARIILDSNDFPQIAYVDYDPSNRHTGYQKCARWTGSSWDIDTVSGGRCRSSAIAVDSLDNTHIIFHDEYEDSLWYSTWNGTHWVRETVDDSGDVGYFTTIVIDSFDRPHLSYYDSSHNDLKYAIRNGTAWDISIVDDDDYAGIWSSMTLDSHDRPYISYASTNSQALKLATYGPYTLSSAPQNLKAVSQNQQVTLTWDVPAVIGNKNIFDYMIYRGTPSDEAPYYLDTVENVLTFTDTNVIENITYNYQISAVNCVGEGEKTDMVTVTVSTKIDTATVPSAPNNPQVEAGDSKITLTWDPPCLRPSEI
jgi:hypothetical protein